jgi:hypothetical protein
MALGAWLAAGSFLLPGPHEARRLIAGLIAGSAIVACSALSFRAACNKLHLVNIVVAICLAGFLLLTASRPASADVQNQLLTAFLLINFAVIPNELVRQTSSTREVRQG